MFVNLPSVEVIANRLANGGEAKGLAELKEAALQACEAFDAQSNHGSPDAKQIMENLRSKAEATLTIWQLQAELERLQRDTLIAIADCMEATASQFERLNQPSITPADLRREAQNLRDWLTKE